LAFFSGFVAGDGSFSVRDNNGGSSRCCALQVKLRADDTPLLMAFRSWTGAGELFAAPARGRSCPQTGWVVARRADCVRIAELLREFPPLGKAAAQFDVWRRAVHDWAAHGGGSPALARHATELRALHRSAVPVPCTVDISRDRLAPFLAGFASAEAHFGASEAGHPRFVVNVRADDGPLLGRFRDAFDLGLIRPLPATGNSQPAVRWYVGRLAELRRLVEILDASPPRGRVANVYAAWRELVLLDPRTRDARVALAEEVKRRRAYQPALAGFVTTSARERRQLRCLEALKTWAATRQEPGSAGDYATWRRDAAPEAPTRNTVAAAFGSWRRALEAAGLSSERAMAPERIAAIRAGHAARREARRGELQRVIVTAVRRCTADLGREPRALEFLRWRNAYGRECPSPMTIYRVFPGGFAEVLAAARLGDA
jgi:hypothetical protein